MKLANFFFQFFQKSGRIQGWYNTQYTPSVEDLKTVNNTAQLPTTKSDEVWNSASS